MPGWLTMCSRWCRRVADLVLVTGATGFVGRALVQRLARDGHAVRAAVRSRPDAPIAEEPAVETIEVGELGASTRWASALEGVRCIVHTAGLAHVNAREAASGDARFHEINATATFALARAAVAARVERLVFVSSIKVNGEATSPGHPFMATEAPEPASLPDAYGRSKAEAERGLQAIASSSGLELVIVRPPLVYGPGVRANFAALVRAVGRGWPLPLGAVRNRRSLVALDNLVDFLCRCVTHPDAPGGVLLVTDGEDLSTPELIRRIAAAVGVAPRLWSVPVALVQAGGAILGRGAAVRRLLGSLQVDSGPSSARIGWTPVVGVDEALRHTVAPLRSATRR